MHPLERIFGRTDDEGGLLLDSRDSSRVRSYRSVGSSLNPPLHQRGIFDPLHLHRQQVEARQQRSEQQRGQQQTSMPQRAAQQQLPPAGPALFEFSQRATARYQRVAAALAAPQAAAAARAATAPAQPAQQQQQQQDENCEAEARPWSPGSADDYSDMPSLINASPLPSAGGPFGSEPPALSPVRNFLAAPPRDSRDYPVQMDLDESDSDDGPVPPLLSMEDGMMDWLSASSLSPWSLAQPAARDSQQQQRQQQGPRQQQQQQQQQDGGGGGSGEAPVQQARRQRHGDDERAERLQLLNQRSARLQPLNPQQHMRPPRITGPRSRPSTRRTTGPQAWTSQPLARQRQQQQQDVQDLNSLFDTDEQALLLDTPQEQGSARSSSGRAVDALYASAVQQVWARTARLSADLLGWNPQSMWQPPLRRREPPSLDAAQRQRHQEEQQEYVQLQQVQPVPLSPSACRAPPPCSFLQAGMSFVGNQKVLQRGSLRHEDQWSVRVTLHDVDYSRGRLSGSMRAIDVDGAAGPIDTYWEGEIIDDVHHTFWTRTWGASRETDLHHWSNFDGFADIKPLVIKHAGRCGQLQQQPTIFMRWKEQFFVNSQEQCGLTIAGFYYLALDRRTGALHGLYYDPNSSPMQQLFLQVDQGSSSSSSSSGGSSSSSSRRSSGSTAGVTAGSSSGGSSSSVVCGAGGGGVSFGSFSLA